MNLTITWRRSCSRSCHHHAAATRHFDSFFFFSLSIFIFPGPSLIPTRFLEFPSHVHPPKYYHIARIYSDTYTYGNSPLYNSTSLVLLQMWLFVFYPTIFLHSSPRSNNSRHLPCHPDVPQLLIPYGNIITFLDISSISCGYIFIFISMFFFFFSTLSHGN